jgi:hypothetical protein
LRVGEHKRHRRRGHLNFFGASACRALPACAESCVGGPFLPERTQPLLRGEPLLA